MITLLHIIISWPFITLLLLGLLAFLLMRYPILRNGCSQLLQSPSGVFGLLALMAITMVTLIQPSVGGTAFAAFAAVVPAILAWVEHKEQLVTMQQQIIASSNMSTSPSSNSAKPLPPSDINSV